MSLSAPGLRVKDTSPHFPSKESIMRSPYVALGLVTFLLACESPTGPGPQINPNVDRGRSPPLTPDTSPDGCLKNSPRAALATGQTGSDATRIPSCPTEEPGKEGGPIN